mmetsp:Transcript_57664/g.187355  ORF Transcript_57664/g.187355 Transcript_57664/m.187355 type:complete len:218 (+) Transcript_57664:2349-3002(+)
MRTAARQQQAAAGGRHQIRGEPLERPAAQFEWVQMESPPRQHPRSRARGSRGRLGWAAPSGAWPSPLRCLLVLKWQSHLEEQGLRLQIEPQTGARQRRRHKQRSPCDADPTPVANKSAGCAAGTAARGRPRGNPAADAAPRLAARTIPAAAAKNPRARPPGPPPRAPAAAAAAPATPPRARKTRWWRPRSHRPRGPRRRCGKRRPPWCCRCRLGGHG